MAKPRTAFADWTLASRPYDLPARLDHIVRMTDGTGIFQHAHFNVPNFREGYCTDDNARAFILCNLLGRTRRRVPGGEPRPPGHELPGLPVRRLEPDSGRFRNFMSHGRQWLEEGAARTATRARSGPWASGRAARETTGIEALRRGSSSKDWPRSEVFSSPRAWAFALLGIQEYLRRFGGDRARGRTRDCLDREARGTVERTAPRETGPGSSPARPTTTRGFARPSSSAASGCRIPKRWRSGSSPCAGWPRCRRPRRDISGRSAATASTSGTAPAPTSTSSRGGPGHGFRLPRGLPRHPGPVLVERGQAGLRMVPGPQRSRPAPLRFRHRRLQRRAARTGSARTRARNRPWPSTSPWPR